MTLYEVVQVGSLPQFDADRSVRHALLPGRYHTAMGRFMSKARAPATLGYFVGAVLFPVVLLVPARVGRVLAMVEAVLELPIYVLSILSMRADLVWWLLGSYDYWFLTTVTLVFTTSFSLLFQDVRAALIVERWLGFQIPILVDAYVNHRSSLLHAIVLNVLFIVFALCAVTLNIVRDIASEDAPMAAHRTLSVKDMVMNTMVTMVILLLRIIVRKYELMRSSLKARHKSPGVAVVKCITIRCSVRLRLLETLPSRNTLRSPAVTLSGAPQPQPNSTSQIVRLRPTPASTVIDSTALVIPSLIVCDLSQAHKVGLYTLGTIGLLSTVACCGLAMLKSPSERLLLVVSCAALTCTSLFVGAFVGFYNRRLLTTLCLSFDFAFLSVQISIAHACVAEMFYWSPPLTIVTMCAWLWVHWVLTLDALTPVIKTKLGLSRQRTAIPVLTLYVCGQVLICLKALVFKSWSFQDRVVFHIAVLGHRAEFRAMPMFLSRMVTVTVWSLRLLWRIRYCDHPDQLMMLRGQVEYDLPRRVESTTLTSVSPAPLAAFIPTASLKATR